MEIVWQRIEKSQVAELERHTLAIWSEGHQAWFVLQCRELSFVSSTTGENIYDTNDIPIISG